MLCSSVGDSEDVIADVCAPEYMRSRDSDEVTVMGTRVPDGWYVVEVLPVALSTWNADKVMETTDGVVLGDAGWKSAGGTAVVARLICGDVYECVADSRTHVVEDVTDALVGDIL